MKKLFIATIVVSLIGFTSMAKAQSQQQAIETTVNKENQIQQNKSLIPSSDKDIQTNFDNLIKLNRAKHLARQTAEQANGGLRLYRAESSMYEAGEDSPHKINEDGSLTFTFKGRSANASEFTILSVVTVDLKQQIVTMNYNGPIPQQTKQ